MRRQGFRYRNVFGGIPSAVVVATWTAMEPEGRRLKKQNGKSDKMDKSIKV